MSARALASAAPRHHSSSGSSAGGVSSSDSSYAPLASNAPLSQAPAKMGGIGRTGSGPSHSSLSSPPGSIGIGIGVGVDARGFGSSTGIANMDGRSSVGSIGSAAGGNPSPRRRIRRSLSVSASSLGTYLHRILSFPQMDFELALWQMVYLVISPRRVYRNVYYNKHWIMSTFFFLETKNQWARDDPAFHVVLALAMCVTAIAYGIAWSVSILGTLRLIVYTFLVEFLGAGILVATITWFITNQFMIQQQLHAVEQSVEWMYAFDIHCNAFVPFFLITYVVQFFFLSIVLSDGFVSRFLANTIYFVALEYYWYITFLGFNALPFLKNTITFLYPAGATFALYLISIVMFNASKLIFSIYFG